MSFRIGAAILCLGAGLSSGLRAGESDDAEQAALLAVLQQETEIATKTRMNADFVPGIVTILEGERLRALGARTVWDVMPYVPGVHATLDGNGLPSVVVRGLQFPFNSGSIQILLNGSPLAREAAGMNSSLLFLPLTQVERVEFIRGPGSVLYGDFAFQGLLNIVTHRQGDELSAEAGSLGVRSLDLRLNGERGGWQASLDVAAQENDTFLPINNEAEARQSSGIASLQHGGFSLQGQWFARHSDDRDGHPPNVDTDEDDTSLEARYATALTDTYHGEVRAQLLRNDIAGGISTFQGDQTRVLAELGYEGWQRQHWLGGIEYNTASIERATFLQPVPNNPNQPPPLQVNRDKSRTVRSAYLQDQIELSTRLRATLGLRYDDSSDTGGRVTPRAALVWQPAEHHVLKAQYAEGTRAPTFFELYTGGNTRRNLDFEVNRTTEINYVYERPQLVLRATAFQTHIDDMVFVNLATRNFGNFAKAQAHGAEFELSRQLGETLRLDANVSWVNARDNRNPTLSEESLGSVPHWMGNLGLAFSPLPDWIGGVHWNYIGTRQSVEPGSGSYNMVDASLTRRHLVGDALDLQLGAQNLLNRRVVQLVSAPFGDLQYPYRDRVAWLRATLRW